MIGIHCIKLTPPPHLLNVAHLNAAGFEQLSNTLDICYGKPKFHTVGFAKGSLQSRCIPQRQHTATCLQHSQIIYRQPSTRNHFTRLEPHLKPAEKIQIDWNRYNCMLKTVLRNRDGSGHRASLYC
jgi:hypothetical protein